MRYIIPAALAVLMLIPAHAHALDMPLANIPDELQLGIKLLDPIQQDAGCKQDYEKQDIQCEQDYDYQLEDYTYYSQEDSYSSCSDGSIYDIIERESGGDAYAENGQYKGIGQLSESYYETYLGKSWSEVKGDYDLQMKAMQDYIADRYGTEEAALAHSNSYGWY